MGRHSLNKIIVGILIVIALIIVGRIAIGLLGWLIPLVLQLLVGALIVLAIIALMKYMRRR